METWDILDENGNQTGKTIERSTKLAQGDYHLVVDVWIMNDAGELLVSRRMPTKHPDPGKWNPVCGSVIAGESSLSAALRETEEELGLKLDPQKGRMVKRLKCGSKIILDVWIFNENIDIGTVTLQDDEADDVRWATAKTIAHMIQNNEFIHPDRVPYFDNFIGNAKKIC
jgi:isopentenyldiphosphate isomerase